MLAALSMALATAHTRVFSSCVAVRCERCLRNRHQFGTPAVQRLQPVTPAYRVRAPTPGRVIHFAFA